MMSRELIENKHLCIISQPKVFILLDEPFYKNFITIEDWTDIKNHELKRRISMQQAHLKGSHLWLYSRPSAQGTHNCAVKSTCNRRNGIGASHSTQ
jgi:hypothetical protein